jgi:hypothetical protein
VEVLFAFAEGSGTQENLKKILEVKERANKLKYI